MATTRKASRTVKKATTTTKKSATAGRKQAPARKTSAKRATAAKPVASGRNYLFHDKLGAQKMIAISEVDPAKTEAANKENYRDAYILGDPEPMKKESDRAAKALAPPWGSRSLTSTRSLGSRA